MTSVRADADGIQEVEPSIDLRATGERIEALLDASSSGGAVARERAEDLVRTIVDLYGSGIERMLDILYDTGRLDDAALDALADDDLVASLLVVHGLHPHDVTVRVSRALDGVRPYLGSHGGDVELLGVSEEGTVRLRLLGSCNGCSSSAATLTDAVEEAIRQAAPEVVAIDVEAPTAVPHPAPLIPVDSLRVRSSTSEGHGAGPVGGSVGVGA